MGKLCHNYGVTVIAATPTFLKRYLKRCEKEQFRTVNLVIVGAEKLPLDLAQEFEEKFGVFPTEGYGTTELSPLGACNVPKSRAASGTERGRAQRNHRPGDPERLRKSRRSGDQGRPRHQPGRVCCGSKART